MGNPRARIEEIPKFIEVKVNTLENPPVLINVNHIVSVRTNPNDPNGSIIDCVDGESFYITSSYAKVFNAIQEL